MTSLPKPISAFGFAIIPVSEYQDLVSGNQTKSDRINSLIENLENSKTAIIDDLRSQIEALEASDLASNDVINALNAHLSEVRTELQSAQQELDAIKGTYRKTLAANAELEAKLSEAIANLTATELQCNEQTVKIATLQTSRNALLSDFDNSKRAVNVELDNHRIAILKAVDNLERSLRNPSVEDDQSCDT